MSGRPQQQRRIIIEEKKRNASDVLVCRKWELTDGVTEWCRREH